MIKYRSINISPLIQKLLRSGIDLFGIAGLSWFLAFIDGSYIFQKFSRIMLIVICIYTICITLYMTFWYTRVLFLSNSKRCLDISNTPMLLTLRTVDDIDVTLLFFGANQRTYEYLKFKSVEDKLMFILAQR